MLFRWILEIQREQQQGGDLVELGAYLGRSAVLIGAHLAPGERFFVVDLFGDSDTDSRNEVENRTSYPSLSRAAFEANYRRIHGHLPEVIQGLSSSIVDHAAPSSVRFMHVDASHLYDHVMADIVASRELLNRDGVVVVDDFRSPHTPGTAAAVWEAVVAQGLQPIAVTHDKFYATWGDSDSWRQAVQDRLHGSTPLSFETQELRSQEILRVWARPAKRHAAARYLPPVLADLGRNVVKRLRLA